MGEYLVRRNRVCALCTLDDGKGEVGLALFRGGPVRRHRTALSLRLWPGAGRFDTAAFSLDGASGKKEVFWRPGRCVASITLARHRRRTDAAGGQFISASGFPDRSTRKSANIVGASGRSVGILFLSGGKRRQRRRRFFRAA